MQFNFDGAEQVACSPDGAVVAYLSRVGDARPYELVLCDADSGRVVQTGVRAGQDDYEPEIAWSGASRMLFLKDNGKVNAFQVRKDLSLAPLARENVDRNLLAVYGRFQKEGSWRGGGDWVARFSHDASGAKEAVAYAGLESHLRVTTDGGSTFVLADNPGLLHLPNRGFGDVCFLGNGNELVFDDYRDIYLLDVTQRKVGWIAHGSKFVTAAARYQRKLGDGKK